MRQLISRIVHKIGGTHRWRFDRKRINEASDHPDVFVQAVACALLQRNEAFDWGKEERKALLAIKALRSRLFNDTTAISQIDHGAGSAHENRTREQMEKGVLNRSSVSSTARSASSPKHWGELMYALVRELQPEKCLELGTHLGISGSYQASAMRLNGRGQLITIEGAPEFAAMARDNMASLGLTNFSVRCGRFKDVLPDILREDGPFDLVFIDGHHDHDATLDYFDMIHPFLTPRALVIFDDIRWSDGMQRAWKRLMDDPRTGVTFDLGRWGLACIGTPQTQQRPSFPLVKLARDRARTP